MIRFLFSGHIAVLGMMVTGVAKAHDDVQPTVASGQITTNGYDDGTMVFTPGLRVFGYDFGEDPADPFFAQDPGFRALTGSGLTVSSLLKFNVISGAQFALPANLTYWDGTGPVSFASVPTSESLYLELGAGNVTINDDPPVNQTGFTIGTIGAGGTIHKHLNAYLYGSDGNTMPAGPGVWGPGDGIEAAAGIYLIALELTSSDNSLANSLPFFLVYNNGMSETIHDDAITYVSENFAVPEPSTLAMSGSAAIFIGLAAVRRRRRSPARPF